MVRIQQLFPAAMSRTADLVDFVQTVLFRQGQRLVNDGKSIQDADEHRKELRERYDRFAERRLPVLQRMGVA